VALLAFTGKPVIVSYMGNDAYGDVTSTGKKTFSGYLEMTVSKILELFINKIIAKSENIADYITFKKKVVIIPNGVNIEKFSFDPSRNYKKELGLSLVKKHILFIANEKDPRKNYQLLYDAFGLLNDQNCEILNPYPVKHDDVPGYINASDVVVLTSYLEGSPNIIKEAMACNCPIVSTDVGDVRWIINGVEGCYLSYFDPGDLSGKIEKALAFNVRTKGRQKIINMGLDQKSIALKLIEVYTELLNRR
jgi:teichuronic acid biosynthesis glycosyltransferase TuaC